MIYASGMETNLSRLLNFLPALVLVGFMIGCGGNTASDNTSPKGDGKAAPKSKPENNSSPGEGNQSVPPKPENNSSQGGGKAATDTAEQAKAKKRRDVLISINQAGMMAKGLINFASGNDNRFPDSNKWCDAIFKDVGGVDIFYSPQHPDTAKLKDGMPDVRRVTHYAFNKVMSGKEYFGGEVVLVFECDLGWNRAGGLADALKYMDKFKLEKIAVSSGDGFARAVTREELKKLKWEITP